MDTPPVDVVDRHRRAVVVEVSGDTCDACPSAARVTAFLFAELPSGRTLSYCAHHGAEYLDGLTAAGARIVDLRHQLT